MKVYYAHCIALYGTPQEARDVLTLELLGLQVVNPNSLEHNARAKEIRDACTPAECRAGKDSMRVMDYFVSVVATCDAVAFRALPDGRIPAGVHKEVLHAQLARKPLIELPSNMDARKMTVYQTREYLKEAGQR